MKTKYLALAFALAAGILPWSTPKALAQKINLPTQVRGQLPCANTPALTGSTVTSAGSCATTPGKADVIQTSQFCSDAGSTDAYACNLAPAISSYVTGTSYRFKANTVNTGAATVNLNSLGAKTIKKLVAGVSTDLADGDVQAGQWIIVTYDGSNMQLSSAVGTSGGAPLDSPGFTGNPTAPTPSTSDSSNSLATTDFVKAQFPSLTENGSDITSLKTLIAPTFQASGSNPVRLSGLEGICAVSASGQGALGFNTSTHHPCYSFNAAAATDVSFVGDFTAPGVDKQIIVNNGGVFAGFSGFTFDQATGNIAIPGSLTVGSNSSQTSLDSIVEGTCITSASALGTFSFNTSTHHPCYSFNAVAPKDIVLLGDGDSALSLGVKPAVTVAATANTALSGLLTIDGVTTADGSIVLASAQTTGSQNGPWVVHSGAWSRPTWYAAANTTQAFQFITTFVRLGTVNAGSTWRITSPSTVITIDTTATTWTLTSSGSWALPPVMVASGGSHASGLTPDTPSSSGSTKFLREDGTWNVPSGSGNLADPGSNGPMTRTGLNVTAAAKVDQLDAPNFCSDAGSTDSYACSLAPAATAYVTGTHYRFMANTANTGTASINFNSLGAKTIVKAAGGITTALVDNDIRAGQWVDLVYDGTNMEMQSTLGNAAGAGTSPVGFITANCTTNATTATTNGLTGLGGAGSFACSNSWSATAAAWISPGAFTIKNLTVNMMTTKASTTYTFTLWKGVGAGAPAATSLTCTVSAGGGAGQTQCADNSNSFTVAAGDMVSVKWNSNATDTAGGVTLVAEVH